MSANTLLRPARVALLGALFSLVASGCAGDSQDWRSAQAADTQEAYEAFVARHPDSEFAAQARERAAQLLEQRDWEVATQADTADSYGKFLARHPNGKWAQEARVRIENFNVMAPGPTLEPAPAPAAPAAAAVPAAPKAAAAAAKPAAAAPKPAAAAPKPVAAPKPAAATPAAATPAAAAPAAAAPAAAVPAAAVPAAVSHRIQLGAFSSRSKADAEWQRLRGQHPVLNGLAPRVSDVQTPSGRLYRLQASVASEARANEICATLKAKGQACLYVPP